MIRRREEIYPAWREARRFSKSGEIIMEEFIAGDELSVDALAWIDSNGNQQIRMTGIADRIITGEPYFIELGHTMPSQKPRPILDAAEKAIASAMQALGITQGAAKGDLRIREDGSIAIGEVAARLSGGFMSSHTYPLSSGVDLIGAALKVALGRDPTDGASDGLGPLAVRKERVAIERCIIGPPGKILRLAGQEAMCREKNISEVFFMKNTGDVLRKLKSNIGKLGHILAVGRDLGEAEAAVERALRHLEIEVDDSCGIDWKEIAGEARQRFSEDICIVCKVCDGVHCVSGIPGMGGAGRMLSFMDNSTALSEWKIAPSYIHEDVSPDARFSFLGRGLSSPIMTAPMTGALTNMGGAIGEYELACILLEAASESGSMAWLGDGASPERYKMILKAVRDTKAPAVLICKPRRDTGAIARRFDEAAEAGVLALGMDIDALSLRTLEARQKGSVARGQDALAEIRSMTGLPFILKGILTTQDARAAIAIGADAIVVSNHGGRILDEMPGTARVLPKIVQAVGSEIQVLADGGIRSGLDAFKMLALGAEAVLFGRMAAIAAVGGGKRAVKFLHRSYREELLRAMKLSGAAQTSEIHKGLLRKISKNSD